MEENADRLVENYIAIREAIEEVERELQEKVSPLKKQLEDTSNKLLSVCNRQNADSIKTAAGTVSRRVKTRYWASDWEAMHDFILENKVPQLLEQRLHAANVRQFLDENPELTPIGLETMSSYTIQVRKATKK